VRNSKISIIYLKKNDPLPIILIIIFIYKALIKSTVQNALILSRGNTKHRKQTANFGFQ